MAVSGFRLTSTFVDDAICTWMSTGRGGYIAAGGTDGFLPEVGEAALIVG
jgi:hypothetical protein